MAEDFLVEIPLPRRSAEFTRSLLDGDDPSDTAGGAVTLTSRTLSTMHSRLKAFRKELKAVTPQDGRTADVQLRLLSTMLWSMKHGVSRAAATVANTIDALAECERLAKSGGLTLSKDCRDAGAAFHPWVLNQLSFNALRQRVPEHDRAALDERAVQLRTAYTGAREALEKARAVHRELWPTLFKGVESDLLDWAAKHADKWMTARGLDSDQIAERRKFLATPDSRLPPVAEMLNTRNFTGAPA